MFHFPTHVFESVSILETSVKSGSLSVSDNNGNLDITASGTPLKATVTTTVPHSIEVNGVSIC
jgi:hypothetical protein